MNGNVDSSRVYRYPSELIELVELVEQADPNNESTWIEWKSTLDLNDKPAHYHIAKHVLGFANRSVLNATVHAAGHAYLIVGAEPGNILGVTPVDPAVLRPKIMRYVGSNVKWHPEYVNVKGITVLVVVVDPPSHGDAIHPVRYQLDSHRKGMILIRHQGSTDPADDIEVDELVRRARAAEERIDVALRSANPLIEKRPSLPDFSELVARERDIVMARPRFGEDTFLPPAYTKISSLMGILQSPDDRSEEDYHREVDSYCERFKKAIINRCTWRMWRHDTIALRFELVNRTELNFTDIEVEVHVTGDVVPWPDDLEDVTEGLEPSLPEPPAVLGTPKSNNRFDILARPNPIYARELRSTFRSNPGFIARETESVTIDFSGVNLRANKRHLLPPVRLLVNANEGSRLVCHWKATASNVPGEVGDSFELSVIPSTLDLTDIRVNADEGTEGGD